MKRGGLILAANTIEHCLTIGRIAGYTWGYCWCIRNRIRDSCRFWWPGTCFSLNLMVQLGIKALVTSSSSWVPTYRLTLMIQTWGLTGFDPEILPCTPSNIDLLLAQYDLFLMETDGAVLAQLTLDFQRWFMFYRQIISGSGLHYYCRHTAFLPIHPIGTDVIHIMWIVQLFSPRVQPSFDLYFSSLHLLKAQLEGRKGVKREETNLWQFIGFEMNWFSCISWKV